MIRAQTEDGGRLVRLTLAGDGRGRLTAMTSRGLRGALLAAVTPDVRAVLIDHDGGDLDLGCGVRELVDGDARGALAAWGEALTAVVRCPVPVLVALRGHALGPAAALSFGATQLFAADDAVIGFHQVALGLSAPGGAALAPWRPALLRRMVLTGEMFDVHQLEMTGLVHHACDRDPLWEATRYYEQHLATRSPVALRAVAADLAPGPGFEARLAAGLARLGRMLEESQHPAEGISAFLERRPPAWGWGAEASVTARRGGTAAPARPAAEGDAGGGSRSAEGDRRAPGARRRTAGGRPPEAPDQKSWSTMAGGIRMPNRPRHISSSVSSPRTTSAGSVRPASSRLRATPGLSMVLS